MDVCCVHLEKDDRGTRFASIKQTCVHVRALNCNRVTKERTWKGSLKQKGRLIRQTHYHVWKVEGCWFKSI